ncbi:MAG: type III pantothenate kinase [Dehalococcoidia bacterium]|nr:type III pantothenate kinase [Dehalococcoidia bacterium]MDD5495172.1 type III pantothenate kinase [Dehalococcoidia bacterium]
MLLAIDIGNTNITFGVFENERIKTTWRVSTAIHRMSDEYGNMMLSLMERQGVTAAKISDVVICSVVPPLLLTFEEVCRHYLKKTPLVVEAGVKTGVRIDMDNPREVGPDRIVNAVAAHHLYGGPVIVIDMGTATTIDVVSKGGDYIGGAIAPGIAIATEALFTRTAVLPRIELNLPRKAIGRNTVAAMQSGIVFGYIGLIEGLVSRIQAELDEKAKVVAAGGFAAMLAQGTKVIEIVNPDLTLVGLRLIYNMNRP